MRFACNIMEMETSGIRKCFDGAGPGCVNLSIGQPDFDTPKHIKEAAIAAILAGQTGYTPNLGTPDLRAAICEKFRRENGLEFCPDQIMVTSGASEALFLAIRALAGPGEQILLPDPGFLSYGALTRAVGAEPVGVPLGDELRMDPEAVAERIGDRTRAVIVNSPANPTGAVQTEGELKALAEICQDKGIALISDEVYEHFIYEGKHFSPARFGDSVITINAVSKTYAMTGWRLGYLAAPSEALEAMLKVHQYVQACASSISQAAALAALNGPQECVGAMKEAFRRRRDFLVGELSSLTDLVVPQGAFYLFPRVGDGDAVAASLVRAGVIAVPGSAFGERGRPYLRLSYAVSDENLKEALRRIRSVLAG
ncbi:MAG: putative aspartate aminotransferase 2 [Methanosaeta sp. PtaB.Bin039]|nr:MAG: putative aspartate aminotransferase 2 [Methanosaeta sp. PtaB.Bin039]HOT07674.1 pyridoxal phosphate-dependent aminotransferase [Methanotrichaceae archaeon]HQF17525.1 pyridoxal phosphate-dependent aminotransferase [Methanotrichaceae archaeon]HQI92070.1 pyridoxal phosphate-dependent aminotransferase [Methanotrichaceae archaeon]HQJ29309.1 pyridoxal phosphate-dependent aminotransferase [Methanotrichaceae archaeon]